VCGDISEENLGLSEADRLTLVQSVELVFHCAALVLFDMPLFDILKTNGKGTQRLLDLAEQMKLLKAFTFVSTAFCQSYQKSVEEKEYASGFDALNLMNLIDANDTEAIRAVEEK
jgi:alcohol-forming fatty acyl-CoA reductase